MDSDLELAPRSFLDWLRNSWRITILALVTSMVAAGVMGATLAYLSVMAGSTGGGGRNFIARFLPERPNSQLTLIIVIASLFLISSLITSVSHRIESLLVRAHVRARVGSGPIKSKVIRLTVARERAVTRGWIQLLISALQPIVFLVVGAISIPRIPLPFWIAYATVFYTIGFGHWRSATKVSEVFLSVRSSLRDVRGNSGGANDTNESAAMKAEALQQAYFARDSRAMRLPPMFSLIFTVIFVTIFVYPILGMLSSPEIGVVLVILFVLHQRSLDFLSAVGRFAWAVTFWRSNSDSDVSGFEHE